MFDLSTIKSVIDLVVRRADPWLERRADTKQRKLRDSPLTQVHKGRIRGIRATARSQSDKRERPVLLIAPLAGTGAGMEGWQELMRHALAASQWSKDVGVITSHFERAITRSEVHVQIIHSLLRRVPAILLYGSVDHGQLRLRVATWKVCAKHEGRSNTADWTDVTLSLSTLSTVAGDPAGRRAWEDAARTATIECARIAECFYVARGRRPKGHLTPCPGAVGFAEDALASLRQGKADGLFRPAGACAGMQASASDDECRFINELALSGRRGHDTARTFAYHAHAAALEAFKGNILGIRGHFDAAVGAVDDTMKLSAEGLVYAAVQAAADAAPQRTPQLVQQVEALGTQYSTNQRTALRKGFDG